MPVLMTVCRLIRRVEENAYSNIALDAEFSESRLSPREKRLAARMFYGVTERRLTIEHILKKYVSKPLDKLDSEVRLALMLGVYQLLYMDSVPDNAAVNNSVALVKRLRKTSASGMVNAVLRSFIRDGKAVPECAGGLYDRWQVQYSCPKELIERICDGYGEERCENLLRAALEPSVPTLRINTIRTSADELIESFSNEGIKAVESPFAENCITAAGIGDIEKESCYQRGMYHVQDLSSQLCCMAVDPQPGETVIDICSAPGGKTFTMAELMKDSGRIYACELHENRTELVRKGAERLGLSCITAICGDARSMDGRLPSADRVLCDVPCSGYGVIRSKPEIRYKPISQSDGLPALQLEILTAASRYVKSGGLLIYSTCTVNIRENEEVVNSFLAQNSDFSGECFGEKMTQISGMFRETFMTALFPGELDCDGFFICRLRRR